jgi:Flp pilus assembly pilin Flp
LRRGNKQLTRFIADATGRTDAEVQVLIAVGAASVLVAGTVAASRGVLRLVDFLADG